MKRLMGNIGAQRIELNEHQSDAEMRREMATLFVAALLSDSVYQVSKKECIETAVAYADELLKKLREK